MLDVLETAFWVLSLTLLAVGLGKVSFVPLSLLFELRRRLRRRRPKPSTAGGRVSIIIPAYNEGPVLDNCVGSILRSEWDDFEVVIVDDGSRDDTYARAQRWQEADPRVRAVTKPNGGKGSALNLGIELTTGDTVLLVDADGIFGPRTIAHMVAGFDDERVGAVCGDDRPSNLDRVQTRLLSVLSHVGTGLVRRSLSLLGCLIIVSGNAGAFRRRVLLEVGGLDEKVIGEDLELTWRILKAGYLVRFEPRAIIYAESPSTVKDLFKQRVRWARGLLQSVSKHRNLLFNPRYGIPGIYLGINFVTMVTLPFVQLLLIVLLPGLISVGRSPLPLDFLAFLGWAGILVTMAFVFFSIALNREWGDLRHVWTLPLWPVYASLMNVTMVMSVWLEIMNKPAHWNKSTRSGVVSRVLVR